jgi:uncharacterized protein (DUF1800 family)
VAQTAARKKKRRKRKKTQRCRVARKRARRSGRMPPSALDSRRRRRKLCAKKKKKKPKRHPRRPAAVVPVPPKQPVPHPPKPPPASPRIQSPIAVYSGAFGVRQAERLLWRAGFGPSPGHAQLLAGAGLQASVLALTRPSGAAVLTGAAPHDDDGSPLAPEDAWGHDHLWFLDRMVRTSQPLVERMTLIWHDWFATSNDSVGQQKLMLDQNELFRRRALGSFEQLVHELTMDPAMILWLNLNQNTRWEPNENYARELMELFTLGADRGAYSETDVRELARALTGWRSDWSAELGQHNFRFDPNRHDATGKTVFGQTGAFDWDDAARMCVRHSMHPYHFVTKLWSYFIPVPPSDSDRQALEDAYVDSGYQVRPIVEAILVHPQLYTGPRMVKPPVVFIAGMLRALRRAIDTDAWVWLSELAGQRLFYPPDVSGWDDSRWLDTSTIRGRWHIVAHALNGRHVQGGALDAYDASETPEQAVAAASAFWGGPDLSSDTAAALTSFAGSCLPGSMATWQQHQYRGLRQNALRQLVFSSPDLQTS